MQINQVLQIRTMFFVNTNRLWEHCVRSVISDLTLCIPLFPPPLSLRSAGLPRGHPSLHFANLGGREEGREESPKYLNATKLCRISI